MLWVERGEKIWSEPVGTKNLACARCHKDTSMRGVAARYPKVDKASGKLVNLEGRINLCRTDRMGAERLRYESEELLALTAYLARQSLGAPIAASIDGAARAHFEAGRAPCPPGGGAGDLAGRRRQCSPMGQAVLLHD